MGEEGLGETSSYVRGLPSSSDCKESACNAGDSGSVSGSVRFPGGGHGKPLQHSSLENPTDTGAWCHKESDTTEQLTLLLLYVR